MTFVFLTAVLGTLIVAPSPAGAVPIPISGSNGLNGLGSFTGTFDYSPTSSTTGTVTVSLTNTTLDGFLTAFVFNIPDLADVTAVLLTPSDADFFVLGAPSFEDSENAAPFGQFDIGAASDNNATNPSFEGGGAPNLGLGAGVTGTFSFALTGTGLGELTASDFLSTLSVPPGAGEGVQSFVVRFRGFEDDGSDKVPADVGNPIPEPGTVLLLSLGLASLSARRLRSRRP